MGEIQHFFPGQLLIKSGQTVFSNFRDIIKVETCYLPNQTKLSDHTKLNISSQINLYKTKTKTYFIFGLSGISDAFEQNGFIIILSRRNCS